MGSALHNTVLKCVFLMFLLYSYILTASYVQYAFLCFTMPHVIKWPWTVLQLLIVDIECIYKVDISKVDMVKHEILHLCIGSLFFGPQIRNTASD